MANEKRLIDANALQRRICGSKCGCEYEDCGCEGDCQFDFFISNAPTVDSVEVVRCKDCKNLEITGCYGECKRGYMGIVKPWDFCSYGERKDNG